MNNDIRYPNGKCDTCDLKVCFVSNGHRFIETMSITDADTYIHTEAFRIVVASYAAIMCILRSYRPLRVTGVMCVHRLASPDQRCGFACLLVA